MDRRAVAFFALIILAFAAGPLPAKEKVKRERALVALPVLVEAVEPGRSYSFAVGELFGAQPAHYRSTATLDSTLPLPEYETSISTDRLLVELQASSRDFTGPVWCLGHQIRKNMRALLCLADRDGDGAFDQLWQGGAASLEPLVPFPDMRSVRAIEPVRFRKKQDDGASGLKLGFYVSGTNPILGQHHFYPVLGVDRSLYPLFEHHKAVSLRSLPKSINVGGGELNVTSVAGKAYQATVTRPLSAGEWLVASPYPTQTIYISVPG